MFPSSNSTIAEVVETSLSVFGILQQRSVTDWLELDLSMAQIKVLFTVSYYGPLPISQIAHIVGIGAPTASHLVDKLVQAGLLIRVESIADRRIVHAQISPQGKDVTIRLRQGRADTLQRWISQLLPDDRAALHQGIRALFQIVVTDVGHAGETFLDSAESVRNESDL